MNKKGFTVIEVVVSFALLAVVMLTIITFLITYRDKVRNAQVETQLLDFKNSLSKIVYDDIILGNYLTLEECSDTEKTSKKFIQIVDDFGVTKDTCAFFLDKNGTKHYLGIKEVKTASSTVKKGLHLVYDDVYYMLPDSDLNATKTVGGVTKRDDMCAFRDFEIRSYSDKIYAIKINYYHYGLDKSYDIILTIN